MRTILAINMNTAKIIIKIRQFSNASPGYAEKKKPPGVNYGKLNSLCHASASSMPPS